MKEGKSYSTQASASGDEQRGFREAAEKRRQAQIRDKLRLTMETTTPHGQQARG